MTTNKPEVVGYLIHASGEKILVNDITNPEGHDSLVRLSDYEALQAECEQLRKRARKAELEYSKVARALKGLERVAQVVSDNSDEVCGENNQLRAECEKLRKDAARGRAVRGAT